MSKQKSNPNVHEENNGKCFVCVGDEKWIGENYHTLADEFHKQNTKPKKSELQYNRLLYLHKH